MKKLLLITLFITLIKSSEAQISIGYNFGLSINNANFSTKKGYEGLNTYLDELNRNKSSKSSFSTSININYLLNNKWSLESGLEYLNKGYNYTHNIYYNDTNYDPAIPEKIQTKVSYKSFSIPLSLYYHLGKSKLNYFIGAGLAINSFFRIQNNDVFTYPDGRIRRFETIHRKFLDNIQLSPLITLACQYQLTDKFKLRFSANYRYDLNDIYPNVSAYKTRLHTATAQLGLYYKLK